MTLDEHLAAAVTWARGTCPVHLALVSWPPDQVRWLDAHLAMASIPSDVLAAAVSDLSPRLAGRDIAHHRAGDCPCVLI